MVTIYLDKQVFSYLFKADNEKYAALRKKILAHRDEFIFCYSNAHLLDLQDDLTDNKYSEMDFMQSVVNGNHLIYEDFMINLANNHPRDVFENLHEIRDFAWLDEIDFARLTPEQIQVINNIVDISTKDFAGQLEFDWIIKRRPVSDLDLQVDKDSFKALMNLVAYNFYENTDSYKCLRDRVISLYNPSSIVANDEVFNEQFSCSPLRLSFIELIQAILKQSALSSNDPAITYYLSYVMLDMFGIDKEKRGKVRFKNVQVDAYHSYFGSYCDCMVSDDGGLRRKSEDLYKLFNQSTKVYSLDEFIRIFDEAIADNRKSTRESFDEIIEDYVRGKVVATDSTPEYATTVLETSHEYFGYFNCMFEMKTDTETMIVLHRNNDLYRRLSAREVAIVVNRITESFNSLGATWPSFDHQKEWSQLSDDIWSRTLHLEDSIITLTKFKKLPMLELLIKLK